MRRLDDGSERAHASAARSVAAARRLDVSCLYHQNPSRRGRGAAVASGRHYGYVIGPYRSGRACDDDVTTSRTRRRRAAE